MATAEVAKVQEFVKAHAGWLMERAGLAVVPIEDGDTYAALAAPTDEALRRFGVTPAESLSPSDDDLLNLPEGEDYAFRCAVLVETLNLLRARLAKVDQEHGIDKQKLSQYGPAIDALLAIWGPRGESPADFAKNAPSFGVVDLGFDGPACPWE